MFRVSADTHKEQRTGSGGGRLELIAIAEVQIRSTVNSVKKNRPKNQNQNNQVSLSGFPYLPRE